MVLDMVMGDRYPLLALVLALRGNYGDRPCKVRVIYGDGFWGHTLRDSAYEASLRQSFGSASRKVRTGWFNA